MIKFKRRVLNSGVRHDASDGSGVAAEKTANTLRAPDGFHGVPDGTAIPVPAVHLGNLHENFGTVEWGDGGFCYAAGDSTGEKGFE